MSEKARLHSKLTDFRPLADTQLGYVLTGHRNQADFVSICLKLFRVLSLRFFPNREQIPS